ncbi:HAMP domain-containing sensor histidine kinase [Actinomadura sp. NPDC048394]|uniref:sensor histidine kinase n=1 Tax=Actinomadura sp. NPDC048394 TaxID=3158223 RepID=UPI0033CD519F
MDGPDARVLSRVGWVLTLQLAAAVTVVIALVGALVYLAMSAGQRSDAERDLRHVIAANAVENAPPCVWMFAVENGGTRRTPNAPAGLPVRADLDAPGTVVREHRVDGISYLVRTEHHGPVVLQAALDRRYQIQERHRLYKALGVAEVGGLLAALVTGLLLARRAISPLAEALDRQRRFVADASHELRTPLTRLHVRAQLLARRTGPGALGDELGAIVSDTRQFGEVIEDLLLSARLRPHAVEGRAVDLAEIVASLVDAESVRAREQHVVLDVAGAATPQIVDGVASALRRVVGALLDNAIGHTPPGGRVAVVLARDGGRIELTVRDDGVGFDPADAERIFQRFTRGAQGRGRRFGLGLALVREVVESHGGTVEASGRPGAGASFTVRLPAASPDAKPRPAARRRRADTAPAR